MDSYLNDIIEINIFVNLITRQRLNLFHIMIHIRIKYYIGLMHFLVNDNHHMCIFRITMENS